MLLLSKDYDISAEEIKKKLEENNNA